MKLLILPAVLVALVGCGTTTKTAIVDHRPQYCHTTETIETKNGEKVTSTTMVECTDDQIKRVTTKRLGMSPYCGEFTYWVKKGGQIVWRKGISCQKPDGSWEVINANPGY